MLCLHLWGMESSVPWRHEGVSITLHVRSGAFAKPQTTKQWSGLPPGTALATVCFSTCKLFAKPGSTRLHAFYFINRPKQRRGTTGRLRGGSWFRRARPTSDTCTSWTPRSLCCALTTPRRARPRRYTVARQLVALVVRLVLRTWPLLFPQRRLARSLLMLSLSLFCLN